jgi:hypothetical membrane protein
LVAEFDKVAGMKMWIYLVLSPVAFLVGCVFGINPHHYVAAAFFLALGAAFFIRGVVVASEVERHIEKRIEHHQ